ncbi:MAG: PadR family transcriptional regulator [Gemmatimonadales bacterium]
MATEGSDLRQGSLDVLVLKALSLEPMHGWGISQRIQQLSNDVLRINQGSLYPALQRLERRGLVVASWEASDNNRRARYYTLSAAGRRQFAAERAEWERYARAVHQVLSAT